ncbi:MAG: lipoate--protein ligase family protein [Chloroflexi bacterium]|nr:lipoate--protein ligase family protein [Chloroflexota bacterium]
MNPIRLLNLGSIPPLQTQSVYHMLAERMSVDEPDTIILCRPNAPYLCLGYHQVFENTFDPEECQRRGLPILRRRLGGGATYLDGNQIFYQCIFHHSRMPAMLKDIYATALAAPVNTLKKLGLNAELRDTNEIEVDGKRIAGTGGGRIGEACVVVGNLLFDFDFEAMTSVWRTPSSSFRSLAEKALCQQLVTLNQLGISASLDEAADMLVESFENSFHRPLQPDTLTSDELEIARQTAKELVSDEFLALHKENNNRDPMHFLKISARAFIHADEAQMSGWAVRGSFWVSQDMIQTAKLESNPMRNWQQVEEELRGVPFKKWQEQIHAHFSNETILS